MKLFLSTSTVSAILACNALLAFPLFAEEKASPQLSSGRWVLHNDGPASVWQQAFVTGNGHVGTITPGRPWVETITCVHQELFFRRADRKLNLVPKVAGHLKAVRDDVANYRCSDWMQEWLLKYQSKDFPLRREKGDALREAIADANKQMKEAGAGGSCNAITPHPAFDLNASFRQEGSQSDYLQNLDLETGEILVSYGDANGGMEERVFSSQADNINVIQFKATKGRRLDGTLTLSETPGRVVSTPDRHFSMRVIEAAKNGLYYRAKYVTDKGGYEGVCLVLNKGGSLTQLGAELYLRNCDEVLVLMRIQPQEDGNQTQRAAIFKELSELPADYNTLFARHAVRFGEMFRRVTLDLGAADQWKQSRVAQMLQDLKQTGPTPLMMEQMFASGRYHLISTSGRYPAALQGMWPGDWYPVWSGSFTIDSNVNLAMAACGMGNLPEAAEAFFGFIERQLPGWRVNAKNLVGTRGFLAPMNMDPENGYSGHMFETYPFLYWAGGAGWNFEPFYDFALLTGDDEFMRKRVIPIYQELAQFYEDYLVMEKDGYYHITPGYSPENFTRGGSASRDTTFDLSVAREVFRVLLTEGKRLGLPAADLDRWAAINSKLVPYRINEDGALAEWIDPNRPDFYRHRHNSNLYGLFPGLEFLLPEAAPKLLEAARVALDKRWRADNATSAHGKMHQGLMAARLKQPERVQVVFDDICRMGFYDRNMVSSHAQNHDIYNYDTVLSMPRLMMEALLFSRPGAIEILPAWPKKVGETGSIKGVLARGGYIVELAWKDGKLNEALIHARKEGHTKVIYGDRSLDLNLKAGDVVRLDEELKILPACPRQGNAPKGTKADSGPVTLRQTISLDGSWQIAEGSMAESPAAFERSIVVPGLVDMAQPAFAEGQV